MVIRPDGARSGNQTNSPGFNVFAPGSETEDVFMSSTRPWAGGAAQTSRSPAIKLRMAQPSAAFRHGTGRVPAPGAELPDNWHHRTWSAGAKAPYVRGV